MKTSIMLGGLALGLALTARPAQAQLVQAGVVIRSGPVTGHVVVVDRYAPRVIVVERLRVPRGHAHGWWRRHGYRRVVVYYDGARYYDRWFDRHRGLGRIEVYESGGRYYRWDGDRDWDD